MIAAAGAGSDSSASGALPSPPGPRPELDPDYIPPGGYQGDLRPRYLIGLTPFEGNPELGTGGDRVGFETPEYQNSWGLARLKAAARYAEGAFGAGALVSVFDSGIDPDHPELADAYLSGLSHSYFSDGMKDEDGHGTHVIGTIAAARNGIGMHGIAPNTRIMAFRALNGDETLRSGFLVQNWEDSILRSVEAGADVMNNSWTFIDEAEAPLRITTLANRGAAVAFFGQDLISTVAYAAQQDLVSVYAAGNGSGGESSVAAGLPVHIEEIRDHWVSVVALNQNGAIAGYSSQCGVAMNWCLAAPGTNVVSTELNGRYGQRSGTSMAAAFVSGSLALLKSNFPEITGATALHILKDTARDLGETGIDPIFGHGAIDLETAMRPVGNLSVQMSSVLNERTTPLLGSAIVASAGVADPMRRSLSASLMSATDAYDRSYQIPMGAMVASSGPDRMPDLTRFALRGAASGVPAERGTFLTTGVLMGDREAAIPDATGFWGGHAALLGDRTVGLTHVTELGEAVRVGVSGGTGTDSGGPGVSYGALSLSADMGASVFTIETGLVNEADGMLGARFYGAFDGISSRTSFLRASADLAIGEQHVMHLTASTGETRASGSGLIRSGQVRSESFGVGVSRRSGRTGSVMSFGLSRPLGISGGTVNMAVPAGIGAAAEGVASSQVRVENVSIGLDRAAAPMDLQFGYEIPVGASRFGLGLTHRVGDDPGAGTSASIGVSFKF